MRAVVEEQLGAEAVQHQAELQCAAAQRGGEGAAVQGIPPQAAGGAVQGSGSVLQVTAERGDVGTALGKAQPEAALDRKSTRVNSSHSGEYRMPSSA